MSSDINSSEFEFSVPGSDQEVVFDCLICGSQECGQQNYQNFSSEGNRFSDNFCILYGIRRTSPRLDVQDIFKDSFLCSRCQQELSYSKTLQSEIEKLNNEIQRIKTSCDIKLRSIYHPTTALLLETGHDHNGSYYAGPASSGIRDETRKKRKKLLIHVQSVFAPNSVDDSRICTSSSSSSKSPISSSVHLEDDQTNNEGANYSPFYSIEESCGEDKDPLDFEISTVDCGPSDADQEPEYSIDVLASEDNKETDVDVEADIKNVSLLAAKDPAEKEVKGWEADAGDADSDADNSIKLRNKYKLKELSIYIERIQAKAKASTNTVTKIQIRSVKKGKNLSRDASPLHRPFTCPHPGCFKKYSEELERDGHVKRAHEGITHPFECSVCSRSFRSIINFKDHQNIHIGLLPYKCSSPSCDKAFPLKTQMTEHFRRAHGQMAHRCDTCGSGFTLKESLQNHMRSHNTDKEFECDICQKTFRIKQSLRDHRFTHPELNLNDTKCSFCGKVFTGRYYLKIHERSHTGELPFKCNVCSSEFGARAHLKKHMVTHVLVKEFECEVCRHAFKSKPILNAHKKSYHPASKDFTCAECGKCFSCKRYLEVHEEIHKEVKRLLCTLCGKSFAQNTSYKYHMRHTHRDRDQDADDPRPSL